MSKVEIKVDIHDNSLDSSDDKEYLIDGEAFESIDCTRTQVVEHSFLDRTEDDSSPSYNFRDLSGAVTYKIVHIPGEESINNMASESPTHIIPNTEYFVISNPGEVFGTTTQKKVIRRQPVQAKAVTTKKRDDKRRATHNEVERRRRDKINSWITKIAAMVPNSGHPDSASKGGILAKACDHIAELTEKQKKLKRLEMDNEKLVSEVLRLNQELAELRKENSSMRLQLADNCIVSNLQQQKARNLENNIFRTLKEERM